ncbi:MAG: GNAT family N-acetyltransferase [Vulcanimicrobiaceae bacterium]
MRIRALTERDIPACLALASNRGWQTEALKWRFLLEAGCGLGFEHEPGKLGGAVTVICYPRIASIGMLVVHHDISGRGHATRLMQAVLAEFPREAYMLFATDQGEPLYKKMGFEKRDYFVTYRGLLARPQPGGDVRVTSAATASPDIIGAIIAADGAAFGDDRATFLRCLLDASTYIASSSTGDSLSFGIAWQNIDTVHIGPVVAHDDRTAVAIVQALAGAGKGPIRIDLSEQRTELGGALSKLGLGQTGSTPLMTFGNSQLVYPGDRYYSPATLAAG